MRSPANRLGHAGPPALRLNALDWALFALIVVCTLGAWAFSCSSASDLRQCMRDSAPKILSILSPACSSSRCGPVRRLAADSGRT